LGVSGIPLKRAVLGLLAALWRDSEGVRRRADRGLREVGGGKRVNEVEKAS